ncbi:MAG: TerB family tellurite resistance protein [Spongiibacteraceae bacterium]
MFDKIKQLFSTTNNTKDGDTITLELAAAALLVEVSKSDYQQDTEEVEKIRDLLSQHYSVSLDELESYVEKAHEASADSTSLYPFTRFINDNCDNIEKYQLVHSLWEVAAEDGRIDKYEEHLIRKIADLIYLPHRDFIRAKLSACEHII